MLVFFSREDGTDVRVVGISRALCWVMAGERPLTLLEFLDGHGKVIVVEESWVVGRASSLLRDGGSYF